MKHWICAINKLRSPSWLNYLFIKIFTPWSWVLSKRLKKYTTFSLSSSLSNSIVRLVMGMNLVDPWTEGHEHWYSLLFISLCTSEEQTIMAVVDPYIEGGIHIYICNTLWWSKHFQWCFFSRIEKNSRPCIDHSCLRV